MAAPGGGDSYYQDASFRPIVHRFPRLTVLKVNSSDLFRQHLQTCDAQHSMLDTYLTDPQTDALGRLVNCDPLPRIPIGENPQYQYNQGRAMGQTSSVIEPQDWYDLSRDPMRTVARYRNEMAAENQQYYGRPMRDQGWQREYEDDERS